MTTKTEDEWDARFGEAIDNEGTVMFETYGEDLAKVEAADPLTVWTVIEGEEENLYLVPGFHFVNRIGYVLSEKPITQEELDSEEWAEVLWVDGNEIERANGPTG